MLFLILKSPAMMETQIIESIDNAKQLEFLYHQNKDDFRKAFKLLYPRVKGNILAEAWNERLNFDNQEISWGSRRDLLFVAIAALLAGTFAKIPAILNIDQEFFYTRNISFIVLPILAAYFVWKNKPSLKRIIYSILLVAGSIVFINTLPDSFKADTIILSCIHIPLFLWVVMGAAFVGNDLNDYSRRIDFLRYNGDLLVISALIVIAGGIMTGITIGLFHLIDIDISKFYFDYIVIYGLSAVPLVGTYLTQTNPQLISKVSPVIAKLFTPLVLITLVIYLVAIVVSGKDPYNDRDFLLTFNFLLLGVMALILFSVTETSKSQSHRSGVIVLLALSAVTIVVNAIALSAIVFRISEWGISPNRMAVLGANLLVLVNLVMVGIDLLKVISHKSELADVEVTIAKFLPIYTIWALVVGFVFPLIFNI
jgi:hypothetical protein